MYRNQHQPRRVWTVLRAATIFAVGILATASCADDDAPSATQPAAASPTAAATATSAPSATATSAPQAKETTETLTFGGAQRSAVVYVPVKLSAAKAPAIVMLHAPGRESQPVRSRAGILLHDEADRLGFVLVLPKGTQQPGVNGCCNFNDGRPVWGSVTPPDDIAFFNALLDTLVAKYPVDADRISFTGAAAGSAMAYRAACDLSGRVAAFAGVNTQRDNTSCQTPASMSMLHVHGTANTLNPYAGGVNPNNGLAVPSVADVIDYWRKVDGCTGPAVVTKLTAATEQARYAPCKSGTEVVLVTVNSGNGDTGWWGIAADQSPATGDADFKTTPLVAEFLIRQTRAGR